MIFLFIYISNKSNNFSKINRVRVPTAIFVQMEDAILIMRAVVLVNGRIHWNLVNVVVVIQVVKIPAIRK